MFLLLKVSASADLICGGAGAGASLRITRLPGRGSGPIRLIRHDPQI
jgi:hypothetical protein